MRLERNSQTFLRSAPLTSSDGRLRYFGKLRQERQDWKPQKLQEKFRETELLNRFFLALLGGMHKERDIM